MPREGLEVVVEIREMDTRKVQQLLFVGDPLVEKVTTPLTVILVECCLSRENIESIYIDDGETLINLEDMLKLGQGEFDKKVTITIELVFGARIGQPEVMANDYLAYYDCRSLNMCRALFAVRPHVSFRGCKH